MQLDNVVADAISIDVLNADLLSHVFSHCAAQDLQYIPFVCRKWASVLSGPSSVWQLVAVDLAKGLMADNTSSQVMVKQWFQQRGSAVQTLQVSEGDASTLSTFLCNVLPDVRPALRHLALYHVTLPSHDIHLLSSLYKLQTLELSISLTDRAWQNHLSPLTQLTALRNLEIEFDLMDSNAEAVEAFPQVITHLPSLMSLSIAGVEDLPTSLTRLQGLTKLRAEMLDPVGFPEAVPALSNLEQLHLRWGDAGMPVHVPAMTTLQRMQSCILEGEGTGAYMVDSLSTLTGLKTLHLNVMALQNIPTWISNLRKLKDLTMRHNAVYAIPEWLPDALPDLEVLQVAPQTRCTQQQPHAVQMTNGVMTYSSVGITVPHTMASMQHLQHLSLTSRLGPVFHIVLQLPQGSSCLLHPRSVDGCLVDDEAWEVDAVIPKEGEGVLHDVAKMVSLLHRTHHVASP